MDERLTPSFWLSELMVSDTAVRLGIPNVPRALELANMRNILAPGLQRIRDLLGKPVLVSSGYRSPALNKAIGGSATSQHCDGLAADFTCPSFGTPLRICQELQRESSLINFDQLIQEGRWVHVGFAPAGKPPRGQVLTAHFSGGKATYSQGLA